MLGVPGRIHDSQEENNIMSPFWRHMYGVVSRMDGFNVPVFIYELQFDLQVERVTLVWITRRANYLDVK
jgi:hypothetical protein